MALANCTDGPRRAVLLYHSPPVVVDLGALVLVRTPG